MRVWVQPGRHKTHVISKQPSMAGYVPRWTSPRSVLLTHSNMVFTTRSLKRVLHASIADIFVHI